MIIKPMIRSSICLNAHPLGCATEVRRQIAYVQQMKAKRGLQNGPKMVLVLGCSTGYGLGSRITAAFEYGADTIGVSFEKAGTTTKGGTPGWYNNLTFDTDAQKAGIWAKTFSADAFSNETRAAIIDEIKKHGKKVDLVVYSLASPVRSDPVKLDEKGQHVLYRSVIKPIGSVYSGDAIDVVKGTLNHVETNPATQDEIDATIKVMGGEDWKLWIDALLVADVLSDNAMTVAYSYIGPKQSHAIYRDGTIGQAKKDLEKTAHLLDDLLKQKVGGRAFVSVNKGLVTRSSSVIPIISLYLSVLFKVMKAAGTHEGCIEQMERLFSERLYAGDILTDSEGRIRIDEKELDPAIQQAVDKIMPTITEANLSQVTDLAGYKHDFLVTNGFDVPNVDYEKDVDDLSKIE